MTSKIYLACCIISWNYIQAGAQTIESNTNREKLFAFEVKHIDEFMERFNYEKSSLIVSYVKTNFPAITINHQALLSSLFNKQNTNWDQPGIQNFAHYITGTEPPVYLDFYSNQWYAEALCKFLYRGKPIHVSLVLRIQVDSNGGAKWVISSAQSKSILPSQLPARQPAGQGIHFLNPMSHATNFMSLSTALHDKEHISDYLDSGFVAFPVSRAFLELIYSNQLKYQYVSKITYHFLQIEGWIFSVDYFKRSSVNSGWLISNLIKADTAAKLAYKNALLYNRY